MEVPLIKKLSEFRVVSFLKKVFSDWKKHGTLVQGAALAFYTIISLPALLLSLIGLISIFVEEATVRKRVLGAVAEWTTPEATQAVRSILEHVSTREENILRALIGGAILFFNVTGVFSQLQSALNTIWDLAPKKNMSWKRRIVNRLISFGSFLLLLFLAGGALLLSGLTSKADTLFTTLSGGNFIVLFVINTIINIITFTFLFTVLFKLLPDAKMKLRDTLIGGFITTILFLIGETILTMFFRYSSPTSSYGVTGSLVILLLWIYYSCQIVFLGAEITHVYAERQGGGVEPQPYVEKK